MKKLMNFTGAVMAAAILALFTLPVRAADYAVQKTFWSVTDFTNVTATATNLAQAIDVTQVSDFALQIKTGITNPSAGSLAIQWETSLDGTFLTTNNPAAPGSSGWFSVPLTNSGTRTVWTTNITVGAVGYWRLSWLTNSAGQSITNVSITGYAKPKRTSRDY